MSSVWSRELKVCWSCTGSEAANSLLNHLLHPSSIPQVAPLNCYNVADLVGVSRPKEHISRFVLGQGMGLRDNKTEVIRNYIN